jgi:Suppressor of fused protein (SUFU)
MDPDAKLWNQVYDARSACFESTIGPLSNDILKMMSMIGVWPGGGLFVIPASKLGPDICAYTTFGFTNPDMPATVTTSDARVQTDAEGRPRRVTSTLKPKVPAPRVPGRAGYGYEILMLTNGRAEWPISFLQWAVNAELVHDAGLLDRVERHAGLTVEDIEIGAGGPINVIIDKARAPLPGPAQLPNGTMQILVATTITADEMRLSFDHGRPALLERLARAGIGQISVPARASTPL